MQESFVVSAFLQKNALLLKVSKNCKKELHLCLNIFKKLLFCNQSL